MTHAEMTVALLTELDLHDRAEPLVRLFVDTFCPESVDEAVMIIRTHWAWACWQDEHGEHSHVESRKPRPA